MTASLDERHRYMTFMFSSLSAEQLCKQEDYERYPPHTGERVANIRRPFTFSNTRDIEAPIRMCEYSHVHESMQII